MADNDVLFNNNRNLIEKINHWVPFASVILIETIAVSSVTKTINTKSNYSTSNITRLKKASTKVNLNTLSLSVEEGVAVAKEEIDNQLLYDMLSKQIETLSDSLGDKLISSKELLSEKIENVNNRLSDVQKDVKTVQKDVKTVQTDVSNINTERNTQKNDKKNNWSTIKTVLGWVMPIITGLVVWYFTRKFSG